MVGTRRTSKIPNNTDDGSFQVSIPEDFDLETFSSLIPDFNVHSPSPDSIFSLYQLLLEQSANIDSAQREADELRAEAEKKDVELDQALQDREQSSKDMEQQTERLQEDLTQIKQERDQLLASQNELQTRITALSTSQSSSSDQVEEFKRRLDDIEHEKRDLITVISRLKQDGTEREDEINTLRSNLKEARQDHQTLETQLREIRATETSTKFKLESLTQQLQLAQSEVERVNGELASKSEEYGNYRRTKQAEFVALQASLNDMTQNYSSSQATLKALQTSYTSQQHQLTQALTKNQDLSSQLAEQEATYSTEANSLRRLVAMLEEREKQAREIVENIEREYDGIGEKAQMHQANLNAEIEKEKKAREAAEDKVEQLQKVLEKMGRGELPIPGSGTPSRRTSGVFDQVNDGMMGLSPTIAMASKVQRSGKSFTEVYADYVRLQGEYEKKCAECKNMEDTMNSVLAQIEERAPLLSQQRLEYERLQSEASQLGSELAQAISDRDAQFNAAQDNAQKLARSSRENELLQQQLDDLGLQVRTLLKEIGRRDDPNLPSDEELANVIPADNVEDVITNNLVVFRSVDQLQEQNQKLLRIVRDLSEKLEGGEREYQDKMDKEQEEAIREAHEAMEELAAQLERQKKHSDGVIQAYVKERDALKAMLVRADKSGQSALVNGASDVDISGAPSALAKELADIQNQFDTYQTEMGVDSVRLREENIASQHEIGQLQAALAKATAKSENQAERQRMLQEQLSLQNQELNDLQRRNQQLLDQWTRVDVECNRVTEDLRVATGRVEQLRNECANLRAEKNIWASVQSRLVEENKNLSMERSHLSDLMSNVQRMHNELERSGENDRRRLESQLQLLENQMQDLKNQVTQERENVRSLSLQKDVEVRDLHNRLDKSTQELAKTRESLVMAETSKVHLEERVGDLTKHLKGNEEKLAVYERRGGSHSTTVERGEMTGERQLETEVAELRSALKVAEFDLSQAKSHVQQFQSISEANETALREFQATHDEYKSSTDAQIAKLESDRQALEERLQAAQTELADLSAKHSNLQKQYDNERIAWANDKKTLEDTIVDLSTSEKVSENDRATREDEFKQLEDRAKNAEERYSNELVAHAESIKTLENLKKQLFSVRATVRDHQTAAETATAKLASSESSWQQQKLVLDNEVKELQKRSNDLVEQNNVLHKHLESVSSQAARIRSAAESTTSTGTTESDASNSADSKLSELRSVVAYLRKEKEIVDLQLELGKQENTRLKSQIDHLQQTLDETRRTLSEEREKAVEAAASNAKHEELMERINQLNILRESNATLRADCEAHSKRAKELEAKLELLGKQLEPAKEEARVASAELQARHTQIKRLEEENRRWQGRNQQLLTKYDRIDPSEMQALKDEIERLKLEKSSSEEAIKERGDELTQHKARVEALEKNLASYKETYAKHVNGFRTRMADMNNAKSKLASEKKELEEKITALEEQTRNLQVANDSLQTEKVALASSSSTVTQSESAPDAELASLRAERDQLLAEKASWTASLPSVTSTSEAPSSWEAEKVNLIAAREQAEIQLKVATEKAETATNNAKNNKAAFEKLNGKLQALNKAREDDAQKSAVAQEAAVSAAIEKVKNEMQAAPVPETSSTDLAQKHTGTGFGSTADVEAAIAAAIAAHDKEREAKMAEEISAAVERGRMEAASKMKLKDSQVVRFQTRCKEFEAQISAWKAEGVLAPDAKVAPLNKAPPPASPSTSSNPSTSAAPSVPSTNAPLPRKPPVSNATANTAASSTPVSVPTPTPPAPGTGRGRGVPAAAARGTVRGVRGGVVGVGAGRGGQPKQSSQPLSGGIMIQGAAKRPASESAGDDSLAKRMKPATGGPIPLRRPPPT